jgi:hypothetical protein
MEKLTYDDLREDENTPFLVCCCLSIAFWVPVSLAVFFGLAALADLSVKQILLITPLWALAGATIGAVRGQKWGLEDAATTRLKAQQKPE